MKENNNSNNRSNDYINNQQDRHQLLHNYDYEMASNLLQDIVLYDLKQKPLLINNYFDPSDTTLTDIEYYIDNHEETSANANEQTNKTAKKKKKFSFKNKFRISKKNTSSTVTSTTSDSGILSNDSSNSFMNNSSNDYYYYESRFDKSINPFISTNNNNERCSSDFNHNNTTVTATATSSDNNNKNGLVTEKHSLALFQQKQPHISKKERSMSLSSLSNINNDKVDDPHISDYLESTVNNYVSQRSKNKKYNKSYRSTRAREGLVINSENVSKNFNNNNTVTVNASNQLNYKDDDREEEEGINEEAYTRNLHHHPNLTKHQQTNITNDDIINNSFDIASKDNTTITSLTKDDNTTSKVTWDKKYKSSKNKKRTKSATNNKEVRFAEEIQTEGNTTIASESQYTKRTYDDNTTYTSTSYTTNNTPCSNTNKVWEIYVDLLSEIIFLHVVKDPCCFPKNNGRRISNRKEKQTIRKYADDLYNEICNTCT